MKHPIKIILSFLLLLYSTNCIAQYFTIKGRQFYDGAGQPFNPIVMPVELAIVHNGPKIPNPTAAQLASDFWYSTTKDFGNTKHFECTNTPTCSTEIIAYLTKIQNMGFNTVRIAGAPQWNPDKTPKANKFYLRSFQYCPNIDLCWDDTDYLEIDKPFNTSPVLDFYLDNMEQFYAIATQPPFNFKIIVELALGGSYISGIPGHQNDYLELMDEYVARFKNNPNLIYYIIASETQYTENFFIKKEDVCNYTTPWYDHLKTQDDYHHLVNTTGIITDVIYWDPSVIKSDIFSLHPYTFIRDFEKTAGYPTYTVARDRVLSQFYWLKNHCPKPWLIGETGFKATNSPANPIVFLDGTETEQAQYLTDTYQKVVDCEGSAYAWWNFQDTFWNQEEGLGLLRHGVIANPPNSLLDKPAATALSNLITNPPLANICTQPANYLDPYNCGFFNPTHHNAVTGTIVDANGNPIKGGVVQALSWRETTFNNITQKWEYKHNWFYYYADDNGNFEVIPYNDVTIGDDRIVYLRVSAPGAEKHEDGQAWGSVNPDGWTDVQMQNPSNPYILNNVNFQYNGIFDGENIPVGNQKDLKGWNSVTVSNTNINGTSNITAREEININSEFHASNTSEVHIFPSNAFIECGTISTFARVGQTNSESETEPEKKEIEIEFIKNLQPSVSIHPNPNSGLFTLEILNTQNLPANISIKDPLGNELQNLSSTESQISLNLHTISKGIYFVETIIDNNKIIKKLIIQ